MINERLFPNIVRKTDNDEKYVNDPTAKRFPLLQLYDELSQKQDTLQILLVGEGSIGKSTSLRLLQAELMIRGIYCARYECRHLNDRSIPDIRKEMEQWPKDTVVMIDAYDELPGAYTKELDELVNEIANAKFPLIVTSRSKPEANVYEPEANVYERMAHYEVCPFADQQIEKILEKEQVPPTAPYYGLLHNTMFLAIYLYLDKYKHEYSINMDDLEDEASFLLTYFHALFLSKDTKTKAKDREQKAIPRAENTLADIGEVVFMNRAEEEIEKEPELPEALNNIVTQKKDDDLGYIITATQIKYENFFVALYMMNELLHAANKKDIDRARRLFDISLMDDHTDAYVYAGQLLRRQEKGKAVLDWLNKVYPKSFCEGYTHVLLLYLGMNKGCFNCGELTAYHEVEYSHKNIFNPVIFGLCTEAWKEGLSENDERDEFVTIDYHLLQQIFHNTRLIEECAFYGCRWLVEIVLPSTVEYIKDSAFFRCKYLTSVTLPKNLKGIRSFAFASCNSLKQINFPSQMKSIGKSAFSNTPVFDDSPIIPSTRIIGERAFVGCFSQLTNQTNPIIKVPNGVEEIRSGAFSGIDAIFYLPRSIRIIHPYAFERFTFDNASIYLLSPNAVIKDPFDDKYIQHINDEHIQHINRRTSSYIPDFDDMIIDECDDYNDYDDFIIDDDHYDCDNDEYNTIKTTVFVPLGSSSWYRSQLPPSCTIIETDFEQNIDIEQENELTL